MSRTTLIGRFSVFVATIVVLIVPATAPASYEFEAAWGTQGSAEGQFGTPTGIAIDPGNDSVYVTDEFRSRIQKFEPDGDFIAAWGWGVDTGAAQYEICTSGCQAGIGGSGDGQLLPDGIATDPAGNVYVADTGNNRIQKFASDGTFLTKWGSAGSAEGQFSFPAGIDVDGAGNVYVADTVNNRVQVFDQSGGFVRMWGWGVDDGSSTLQVCTAGCQAGAFGSGQGQLSILQSLAVTSAGDLVHVSDTFNHRVQTFTSAGAFVGSTGGNGTAGGQFNFIDGIAIDGDGNLLVADPNNQRIQKLSALGAFLGTWGWGVSDGSSEFQVCASGCQAGLMGPGAGQFHAPFGIGVDSTGHVFVADRSNARVQRFATIAPATTIDSGPPPIGSDPTTSFTFRSSLPDSTFECRVDANAFGPCNGSNQTTGGETTGAHNLPPLLDGDHSFDVRALDHVAIRDATPAQAQFVVDTQPPSVHGLDVAVNSRKRRAKATFAVSDPAPGTATETECRLDSREFSTCESPWRYRHLDDGKHRIRVRASDEAGNQSSVAKQTFKVKR